jgi:hypothetical protein
MPTMNTPIRLTAEDRAKIAAIQQWTGLPSLAAVLRYCIHGVHDGFVEAIQEGELEPAGPPGHPGGSTPGPHEEQPAASQ